MCIRRGTNSSKEQITQDFFFRFYFNNQIKHLHSIQEWGTHYTHSHVLAAGKRQSKTAPLPTVFNPSMELKCLESS